MPGQYQAIAHVPNLVELTQMRQDAEGLDAVEFGLVEAPDVSSQPASLA
jgi:hypothetical protein